MHPLCAQSFGSNDSVPGYQGTRVPDLREIDWNIYIKMTQHAGSIRAENDLKSIDLKSFEIVILWFKVTFRQRFVMLLSSDFLWLFWIIDSWNFSQNHSEAWINVILFTLMSPCSFDLFFCFLLFYDDFIMFLYFLYL